MGAVSHETEKTVSICGCNFTYLWAQLEIFMQNIKNIIFDYGNVIFSIDFTRAQAAFRKLGVREVDSLYAHHGQDGLFDNFDKGLITSKEFRDGIRHLASCPDLEDEAIDAAWNALLLGVPPGHHDLLREYKARYRTFLLSNNNEIHYRWIHEHLLSVHGLTDNSSLFEKTYYSHLMGLRKPDRQIFEFVLEDNGLMPEETLFIDDSPQHLETARSLGMHTIMVPSTDYFREMTDGLGLL